MVRAMVNPQTACYLHFSSQTRTLQELVSSKRDQLQAEMMSLDDAASPTQLVPHLQVAHPRTDRTKKTAGLGRRRYSRMCNRR
jgi:hypothetical protein